MRDSERPDQEQPGMWESSDFYGGEADNENSSAVPGDYVLHSEGEEVT